MMDVSAFRWQLSEALRSSSDIAPLYGAAVRLLGLHLRPTRALVVVLDGADVVV